MDKNFASPFLTARSPFSPKSKLSESKRSAFRKSSRLSVSGKSSHAVNQILIKSVNYNVETFGQPLPVLVTEALTFSERNKAVTANMSENGYAWLVCGRRLLIWQYRQTINYGTPQRKGALCNQCIELKLPQSDLSHKAELVSVFVPKNSMGVACIAVSPEGVVRYWPSIMHEGVSIEECVDLQGQECDNLTETDDFGCILATTTCTIVLVQPQLVSGRHVLSCKIMKTPTGWLGGLGKKMSSLIFGPITTEQSGETRPVKILKVPISDKLKFVYILTGNSLQKWKLTSNELEQMIFGCDLNSCVVDGFFSTAWENCNRSQSNADVWILDLQADKENVILLVAGVHSTLSPHVHYGVASIKLNQTQTPVKFDNFRLIKLNDLISENNSNEHLSYRFELLNSSLYIYNKRSITVVSSQDDVDVLEFVSSNDCLLCGCICVNVPIFFTRNYGFVSVCNNDTESSFNAQSTSIVPTDMSESMTHNLTIYGLDPDEVAAVHKDTIGQLKAAFIFHVQNQVTAAKEIIDEIFPFESFDLNKEALDKSIIKMCEMLLDDSPTGDPRWSKSEDVCIGSSYSMQIIKHLEDKQRALALFYKFLKDVGLWDRLSFVEQRETTICTVYLLGEYMERIIFAIALKKYISNEILETAIERSVSAVLIDFESGLTYQDVFYKDITKIHRVFKEIANFCEQIVNSVLNPNEVANVLLNSNKIILNVLEQVIQWRQTQTDTFIPSEDAKRLYPEYVSWVISSGPNGLYDSLIQQQSLTYSYGIKNTTASSLNNALYDQLVYLIDVILDGRKNHLASAKSNDKEEILLMQYQNDRRDLIKPLINEKQWERAALLAEKYLDFETLIVLCERTNNEQRLDEYLDRFSALGFPQFLYSWYLQENKQWKLLNKCKYLKQTKYSDTLNNFLSDHPTLSWIQLVYNNDNSRAADVLHHIASQESESLRRQKTMLSLSKLAKLSSDDDDSDFLNNVNGLLNLIEYQEEIPDYVLQQFGYDPVNPSVIPPIKMIHLYTCPEYKDATEIEFKKALDLIPYVDQEVLDECKLRIWKRAILADSWNEKNLDSPLEVLQNKLFFKLAEFSLMLGADLQQLMVPLDILIEDVDLQQLYANKSFQFLLKTAYEHFS